MSKFKISRESRLYRFADRSVGGNIELVDPCHVFAAAAYGVGLAAFLGGFILYIIYVFGLIFGRMFHQVVHGSGVMPQAGIETFLWGLASVTLVLAFFGALAAAAFGALAVGRRICSKFELV